MSGKKISRRTLLASGAGTGLLIAAACKSETPVGSAQTPAGLAPTPAETEGPFYPIVDQADKDADLTRIGPDGALAEGAIVLVEGRVLDETGAPLAGAVVDIWQANAAGRYAHEKDPNTAPLDPKFQGWAIMTTDANGRYGFKTVKPGPYPAGRDWWRPPHIHFKVARRGYREVTTQMYFEGETLNDVDRLLQEMNPNEQEAVVAQRHAETGIYRFDVVLREV
jgi:protocatechuate 3,4-dioxygenase beta subunit